MANFSVLLRRHFSLGRRPGVNTTPRLHADDALRYGAGARNGSDDRIGKDADYPRKGRAQDLGRRNPDSSSFPARAASDSTGLVFIASARFAPTLTARGSRKFARRDTHGDAHLDAAFCFLRDIALEQNPTAVPTATNAYIPGLFCGAAAK
jgi:hypothetical protein